MGELHTLYATSFSSETV